MKSIISTIAFILFYSFLYSQGSCSANGGIPFQQICDDDQLTLIGFEGDGFSQPLDVTWSALASNPGPVNIDSPNSLETTVEPAGNSEFVPGTYFFMISVVCEEDGIISISTDTVRVEVTSISTLPIIENPTLEVCGNSFTFYGSIPESGITPQWVVTPTVGTTTEVSADGTEFTVTNTSNLGSGCSPTVTYSFIKNECEEKVSTSINFITSYTSLYVSSDCSSCTLMTTLTGESGCGGTPLWTIIETPSGVLLSDVSLDSPNSSTTDFYAEVPGVYIFEYTYENGNCPSATETISCTLLDEMLIDLGSDIGFVVCEDEWTHTTLELSVKEFANVTYTWTVEENTLPGVDIVIESPASFNATVSFIGDPEPLPRSVPEGAYFRINVNYSFTDCMGNFVVDDLNLTFLISPRISIEDNDLSFLCGGPSEYKLLDNIDFGGMGSLRKREITAISAPPGSEYVIGSPTQILRSRPCIDLSVPGEYSFLIEVSYTAFDPVSGEFITCEDEATFNATVADPSLISAGADGVIESCIEFFPLNGSIPMNEEQQILDIPVLWEQISGPSTGFSDSTIRDPTVGPLEYGNTYVFVYSYPNDDPNCALSDMITIEVPEEEECEECALEIEVGECRNGCYSISVIGAETYMWSSNSDINDTSSSAPVICPSTLGNYTVFGLVDGRICGSRAVELEPCTGPESCEFTLEPLCTKCSCGEEKGGGRILDSDGNPVDANVVTINWFYNGVPMISGVNPFYTPYEGPAVVSAEVLFEGEDLSCSLYLSGAVTCLDDCPVISFVTCADEAALGFPECKNFKGPNCGNSGFFGYVWGLDQAGNIMEGYHLDWLDQVGNSNPNFVSGFNDDGECIEFPVRVFRAGGEACDEMISFKPDCCSQLVPEIECDIRDGEYELCWDKVCTAESFVVRVECSADNVIDEIEVSEPDRNGSYCVTVPTPKECEVFSVTINSVCSDGSLGPDSKVLLGTEHGCLVLRERSNQPMEEQSVLLEDEGQLSVFPNPVILENLTIELPLSYVAKSEKFSIRIIDAKGQLIKTQGIQVSENSNTIELNNLSLEGGLYFLSVLNAEGNTLESTRFIKF